MNYEPNEKVSLGDAFLELVVQTTHGILNLPEVYQDKWLVLFSHPASFTPVCTSVLIEFQRQYSEFKNVNTEVIGLSIGQVFSHIKWIEWIKKHTDQDIDYPIIVDPTASISNKLGLIQHNKGIHTVRATLIIDPDSVVRFISYYPHELGRNVNEILRILNGLQISDYNKVGIPANWPNNELFEDKTFLPPPINIEMLKKRKNMAKTGKIEGLDWWFCYTPSNK